MKTGGRTRVGRGLIKVMRMRRMRVKMRKRIGLIKKGMKMKRWR